MLKILGDKGEGWVPCLEGVLFAHRTAKHASTGFSPFRLLYGRDPKLPVDVAYNLKTVQPMDEFDEQYVTHVVDVMTSIRSAIDEEASTAITKAQLRQKEAYDKRHILSTIYKSGDKVLIKNLRRADRKGGKSSLPWSGPYTIVELFNNNVCSLSSEKGLLKTKQNLCNLKMYLERSEEECDDNNAVQLETNLESNLFWIQNLNLTHQDKSLIQDVGELNDKIVDAAVTLLRKQFPLVDGLDSPVLSETADGFCYSAHQCVQIHFDRARHHWVTSATTRMRVELADSIFSRKLSATLCTQLRQKYSSDSNPLSVYIIPVDQQTNSIDCGVYAIANAVEFLFEDGNPESTFNSEEMRQHLIQCLEAGQMTPFPKSQKKRKGRKAQTLEVIINN